MDSTEFANEIKNALGLNENAGVLDSFSPDNALTLDVPDDEDESLPNEQEQTPTQQDAGEQQPQQQTQQQVQQQPQQQVQQQPQQQVQQQFQPQSQQEFQQPQPQTQQSQQSFDANEFFSLLYGPEYASQVAMAAADILERYRSAPPEIQQIIDQALSGQYPFPQPQTAQVPQQSVQQQPRQQQAQQQQSLDSDLFDDELYTQQPTIPPELQREIEELRKTQQELIAFRNAQLVAEVSRGVKQAVETFAQQYPQLNQSQINAIQQAIATTNYVQNAVLSGFPASDAWLQAAENLLWTTPELRQVLIQPQSAQSPVAQQAVQRAAERAAQQAAEQMQTQIAQPQPAQQPTQQQTQQVVQQPTQQSAQQPVQQPDEQRRMDLASALSGGGVSSPLDAINTNPQQTPRTREDLYTMIHSALFPSNGQ